MTVCGVGGAGGVIDATSGYVCVSASVMPSLLLRPDEHVAHERRQPVQDEYDEYYWPSRHDKEHLCVRCFSSSFWIVLFEYIKPHRQDTHSKADVAESFLHKPHRIACRIHTALSLTHRRSVCAWKPHKRVQSTHGYTTHCQRASRRSTPYATGVIVPFFGTQELDYFPHPRCNNDVSVALSLPSRFRS